MEITHNFILGPCDTDSISFVKPDQSPFTEEEQQQLLDELNSLMPEKIKFEHDGYFTKVIAVKSKNYVLYDGKDIKIKGSGLKATMKEVAIQECTKRLINSLLGITNEILVEIYNSYVKEIFNVTDISRWTSKKTITHSVLNAERANEQKVLDAIGGKDLQEGDKVRVYFKYEGEIVVEKLNESTGKISRTKQKQYSLKCEDDWDNDHAPEKLLEKLYKNIQIFKNVLDMQQFPNYTLSRNKKALDALIKE